MMKRLLAVIALTSLAGSTAAADKPNFSGEWKINAAKSDYGQVPLPESFVRRIRHVEPSIEIVEEQTGPGTTPTSTRKMKTDGQPVVQQINGADVSITALWDGAALIATTTIESFGVTFKDRMSLSTDGKVLTSVVQVESGQGNVELKIVFDQQK